MLLYKYKTPKKEIEEKNFFKTKSSKLLQNSFQEPLNQKYTPT